MNKSLQFLIAELPHIFKGDFEYSHETLSAYSHDASLLEIKPLIVVFPKDAQDVKSLVGFVRDHKQDFPDLSITARAAGTDMSGGAIGDSIILDTCRYMKGILSVSQTEAKVLPGTYYRDFETETLKKGAILPCYTASKNLNAMGGMVANNSAGEKTLKYGKMEDYVKELKVVLRDGNEYVMKPLNKAELDRKMSQNDVEGEIYREIFDLVTKNAELLNKSKPKVSKNSSGYYLWNVYNSSTGIFDMTKLVIGSQGTLGIVTEMVLGLVPVMKYSKLFVMFMPELSKLGLLVNEILPFKPESVETYDDSTMKFAIRNLPDIMKVIKVRNFFKMVWQFIPEGWMMFTGGIPKLILLVEFSGDDERDVEDKMQALELKIAHFGFKIRMAKNEADSEKYWTIRHESFNLLRKHVRGRRTAPFVDDIIVNPEYLPEFLPKIRKILDEYKLLYTIAGHAGDGNFHIIPLMNMTDKEERKGNLKAIEEVSDKVYDLVLSYKGSISAEHNDGLIRTPYLLKMFGQEVVELFRKTKNLFDPENIFNPNKKVGGTKKYMMEHIT